MKPSTKQTERRLGLVAVCLAWAVAVALALAFAGSCDQDVDLGVTPGPDAGDANPADAGG
jgi:hypothetical protein